MSVTTEGDIYLKRELEDGALIEFEERVSGFRAYWYTPPGGGERKRFPSVTTILGAIVPKPQLLRWYEECGATAAVILERSRYLGNIRPENAVHAVREAGNGAEAHLRDAGNRGKRVHSVLEAYAATGDVPNPAAFPESDRGYIRGLIRWLLKADPQIEQFERLVANPGRQYAGRYDIRGKVYGLDLIVDLKTNRRAAIYREALLQIAGYDLAEAASGGKSADGGMVVAVGPDGTYAEGLVPGEAWEAWPHALNWYQSLGSVGECLPVK
jgi:hypothetical protein